MRRRQAPLRTRLARLEEASGTSPASVREAEAAFAAKVETLAPLASEKLAQHWPQLLESWRKRYPRAKTDAEVIAELKRDLAPRIEEDRARFVGLYVRGWRG